MQSIFDSIEHINTEKQTDFYLKAAQILILIQMCWYVVNDFSL